MQKAPRGGLLLYWRRGRDSNPRRGISPNTISNRALSTAQPPLRIFRDSKLPAPKPSMVRATSSAIHGLACAPRNATLSGLSSPAVTGAYPLSHPSNLLFRLRIAGANPVRGRILPQDLISRVSLSRSQSILVSNSTSQFCGKVCATIHTWLISSPRSVSACSALQVRS